MWRLFAAAILQKRHQCRLIVTAGSVETSPGTMTNVSSVMKSRLMELGVPSGDIIEAKPAKNTLENLVNCADEVSRIIGEEPPRFNHLPIGILSSEWHLPRIQTILHTEVKARMERPDDFNMVLGNHTLIGAETILVSHDSRKWLSIVSEARTSEEVADRFRMETQGIRDIMDRKYRY